MTQETGKMVAKSKARAAYHHGDLPSALILHTERLLAEKGVDGFSLREVARRAGVAAAAPSHHFGNATGLLTAVAAKCFQEMNERFDRVAAKDLSPEDHLVEICKEYADLHRENPGGSSIMFKREFLDNDDETLSEFGKATFDGLQNAVRRNLEKCASEEEVAAWSKVLWACIHGLVHLRLTADNDPSELMRRAAFASLGKAT